MWCVVPLLGDLLFPVLILLDLVDSVLDDGEDLPDLEILHVLVIVKLISEFKQFINFSFLGIFLLLFSDCPRRFLPFLLRFALNRKFLML